jgi:AraC-like DNA-binding protein
MKIERELVRHPDASMRCLQLRLAAFRGGLHRHAHAELTWIERGHGLRWVGDSVEPFGDGDLVLLGAELAHVWLTPQGGEPQRCAATVLQFPVDWAASTGLPELRGLDALMARAAHGLAVEGRTRHEVQALMARMAGSDAPRRVAALVELLAVLHASLRQRPAELRALSAHAPGRSADDASLTQRHQRLDRLLRWVQAHLAEELRVADAAEIVGVSPAAFARYFRRETGKGFVDFVNDARCSWAALRLLQGQESIADIAHGCGFPTLSNFGDQFRRRYEASPRDYRRHALRR